MKKLIAVALLILSATAIAADQQGNRYNPNSYGSPQLYYSPEAMHEREEERALKEAAQIERERLEIERQRLQEEKGGAWITIYQGKRSLISKSICYYAVALQIRGRLNVNNKKEYLMQIEKIDHETLCDILEVATITSTVNHAGMLSHQIEHPDIGPATTIQGISGDALLIKGL